MNLQTSISIKQEVYHPIEYASKIVLLGSCFSENIGNLLSFYKFQSHQNPFGILFHPKAIETLITNAINKKVYTEKDIFFANEQWHCFDVHSRLSTTNKEDILANLNTAIQLTNNDLHRATHIVITLGTAWVYRFIETDTLVANCHKIPQKKFLKEILTIDEISESLEAIILLLKSVNKNITVLFTVSPVRHLKDGFVENTQSKAHLIAGIHQVIDSKIPGVSYFPAYEIMMDELRDYRFYAEDLVHPNNTAIQYIWEKFTGAWISEKALPTMQKIETIQKGMMHRPFNENSDQHIQFLKNLAAKKATIQSQFPHITF